MLFINSHNSPIADVILYHITRLPELAMIVFVVFLGLFHEKRVFLAVVVAMSLCGLSILLFKLFLFSDFNRPFQWLNSNKIPFHAVDGIRLHSNGSFPSGHTMSAFCSLALVAFISNRGIIQIFLFLLACASAFSRVYAAQHYLMDVYAGAIIGFTYAFFFYTVFQNKFTTLYWKKPLIQLKK